ncbi:M20 metallopeptidase family protein [Acetobacterium tundrae]|uniref:Amidohydrolase n=1 Tax=Acetobacterium tundrae TaxID=132932 RepID=A0ABR6WHG7_9FIRM|nr:amidohydrolase [Acetobacterium tundrae]MBC3795799.1 amidohydrolase [Acetobacterium tundrae]
MNILSDISKEKAYLLSVRRHLHKNPELSLKEFATATYIEEQLDSFGIAHHRVGETGVLGIITGNLGRGKKILLRADIDALPIHEKTTSPYRSQTPNIMHACGHDVHTAALLGAAKVLQSQSDTFAGQVLLVFQAAEEFGHGSQFFLAANVTQGVDRAFGIHVSPEYPVGTIAMTQGADAASCDYFKITVKGKGAHISKTHKGIDALHIASLIVTELKILVKWLLDPLEVALIGVGKISSGTSYNIIAEDAVLEGTTRTFSYETQALLQQKITELANHIAVEHGGKATTAFETFTAPLINDDTAFDEVLQIADAIVGKENIVTDSNLITGFGSDDFAEYLKDIKGVYIHVGTSNDTNPDTQQSLHSSKFDIDEEALLIAASLHTEYALSFLKRKNPWIYSI